MAFVLDPRAVLDRDEERETAPLGRRTNRRQRDTQFEDGAGRGADAIDVAGQPVGGASCAGPQAERDAAMSGAPPDGDSEPVRVQEPQRELETAVEQLPHRPGAIQADVEVLAIEAEMGVSSRLVFGAPDIRDIYWMMLGLAIAATGLRIAVDRSRFGHGLRSLRENELAAETVGVPIARYKLLAYVLSAIIPGMVGGVMALRSTYFEPVQAFDATISVNIILMAVIGGGDSARGPLLGVAFLVLLSEWLWAKAPQLYMIILGLLLVVFVLEMPGGLAGWLAGWQRRRAHRQGARS